MAQNNAFLGRGWSFPPTFEKSREEVNMVSEEQDIHESIEIILSTKLGERIMKPKFGCNLDDLLFSSIDLSLITYISSLVETSILLFEPRIDLNRVNIDTSNELEGYVNIELDYTIRTTNSRRNLVYPFYRGEGTDV
ncbi:MAG: GPW/gp25 family protein [Crocinitomicaceae bacterium]